MELRNYVILKSPDLKAQTVYMGPRETASNRAIVAAAVGKRIRHLVDEFYSRGYDVIVARGQNLKSLKSALPELDWSGTQKYQLIEVSHPDVVNRIEVIGKASGGSDT